MNINDEYKVVWWLPTRTASRSISEILAYYKFYNYRDKLPCSQSYTHAIGVPPECKDYTLVCNIRNPYAKVLSTWHIRCFKQDPTTGGLILEKPFDQFVSELQPNSSEEHEIVKQAKKPDIAIRMEYMVEDLHKLPFIDFNDPTVQFIIDSWIKRNAYTSEGCMENHRPEFDLRRNEVNPAMTDFLSYYTQKELDIVWDLYKDVFNEFGYQREYV